VVGSYFSWTKYISYTVAILSVYLCILYFLILVFLHIRYFVYPHFRISTYSYLPYFLIFVYPVIRISVVTNFATIDSISLKLDKKTSSCDKMWQVFSPVRTPYYMQLEFESVYWKHRIHIKAGLFAVCVLYIW
jgi:hypothetical protein